jgi:hypothetical protein
MKNRIPTIEDFANEQAINEAAGLFGDMETYIARFKNVQGFETGETLAHVSGGPDEFPELDSKLNWKKDGWNYTSVRRYSGLNSGFKDAKEILDLFTKEVIGPNKKEWKATNVRKAGFLMKDNKGDRTIAFEHPALGFIFLYVWDSRTNRFSSDKTDFQIQGYFMNAEQYWGNIEKYPQLKVMTDDILDAAKDDDAKLKAVVDYIKNKASKSVYW